jgi:ornithine cyclodeaminase/alanine dehydrogenase-like protein (mu-crystallin family)
VTSIGGRPPRGDLDSRTIERGKLFVEHKSAFAEPPVGCMELSGMNPELATELGDVLSHRQAGRDTDDQVTVFKSMGNAAEDVAAAALVWKHVSAHGTDSQAQQNNLATSH